jgi:AbrB family looped-hinge helix DNA binding protein
MRITSKGQANIPQNVREQMGFLANTEVEFFVSGNNIFLQKAENDAGRGEISDCLHEGKGNCGFAHE